MTTTMFARWTFVFPSEAASFRWSCRRCSAYPPMQAPAARVGARVGAVVKAGEVGKVAKVEHRSRMEARSTARSQTRLTALPAMAARAAGRSCLTRPTALRTRRILLTPSLTRSKVARFYVRCRQPPAGALACFLGWASLVWSWLVYGGPVRGAVSS